MPNTKDNKFSEFFGYIFTHFSYIDLNVMDCLESLKPSLDRAIIDYNKFVRTLTHLIDSKLIVYVPSMGLISQYNLQPNYTMHLIYKNYVIPLTLFMNYFDVNVKTMPKLYLFIIPSELYENYYLDHRGEYFEGTARQTNTQVHSILVKEYPLHSNMRLYRKPTLITLFHELTHVIDNIHFNSFMYLDIIEYRFRWSEINAKYLSKLFYEVYNRMLSGSPRIFPAFLIDTLNHKCAELDDLYSEIKNLNNTCHVKFITKGIDELNISVQYTHSMHIIENIQARCYNLIEELK